jgi:sugar phosphate isomerase/epimerase
MTQNRRTFLKSSASATTALLLSSLDVLSSANKPTMTADTKTDLHILATNWGFPGSLDSYCAKVKEEGYNGIEIWWPLEKKGQDELFAALKKYGLSVGFLCGGSQPVYEDHFAHFKQMTEAAAKNKVQTPLYINCHSGRDYFSYQENKTFIDFTTALSKDTGILILHETHRSRILYSAPAAKHFLVNNPELKITLDASHWCNVSESLLQDQADTMKLATERTGHIHARIGHAEGPQVNDPRAPEWEAAVKAHLAWWDAVVERKRKARERITILTEFGPPDYMPVTPYTRQPLADQWAINVHMMQLLRKRYLTI